ncbi:hypothetical protein [Chamaesiphon minutus]|nr:hypothetical protein [Chamaesiphon minutus]
MSANIEIVRIKNMQVNSKSSIIYVKPIGGLCNRLRVIDSALTLARQNHSYLHVIWHLNAELNCRFEDLFELPTSIDKIEQPQTSDLLNRAVEKLYRTKIGGLIQNFYLKDVFKSFDLVLTYDRMDRYHNLHYRDCNFPELTAAKRAYITTPHSFYPAARPFRDFVPVKRLQQIIDEYSQNFDRVVGVHIRRTDNRQSSAASSTAGFIELMQAEIQKDDRTKFFVATDSELEEHNLKLMFPDRIVTYPKQSLDRNNPKAIQDAVIDLYCLSKCRKLIGSYYSSFTALAYQIHNIDYTIVKDRS